MKKKKQMSWAEFKKRKCPECNGTGILYIDEDGKEEKCKKCKGEGIMKNRGKKK